MEDARRTTRHDVRRTLTCAALATITTLGMFSVIANVMTPMFASMRLLSNGLSAQEVRVNREINDERVCVQTVRAEGAEPVSYRSLI